MGVLSFLTDPPVVVAILDQTPAFDPAAAEPVLGFVFDQSLPEEADD
jgi:hypothetical protein